MEAAQPQHEHQWLQQFVGEWTCEGEAIGDPGEPSYKSSGSETVRSIGGLWILGEGQMEMQGAGAGTYIVALGYDPTKKCFVGSWLGSMMSNLWVYEGSLDAAEKVLTLECEGPSHADEMKKAKYRDVHELKSSDERVLTTHVLGDDGKWTQFMTATYRRKK